MQNAHSPSWRPATTLVTGGRPGTPGRPLNIPIAPASNLVRSTEPVRGDYSREDGTETWAAFEQVIGELERGEAIAFASGMAAISAVIDLVPVGATVAVPSFSYGGTRTLVQRAHASGRVRAEFIHPTDTAAWCRAARSADLLLLESVTNPTLEVMEVDTICAAASRAIVAVDATFVCPLRQRPLELGADLALHSATKLIGGHSDLLAGVVSCASSELAEKIRLARTLGGATPGALEAYLALRGLRTLDVRLARASENAAVLAGRLREHPAVESVSYPTSPDHPQTEVAARILAGGGQMISFQVSGTTEAASKASAASRADRVCRASRLIRHATSLGGVESTMERRAALPADSHVPAGLIRFSVGIEQVEDLWADLAGALESLD